MMNKLTCAECYSLSFARSAATMAASHARRQVRSTGLGLLLAQRHGSYLLHSWSSLDEANGLIVETTLACLPRHPAVAYLFLVRR